MLKWFVVLAVALLVAGFGSGGTTLGAAGVVEMLFCLFLVVFVAVMLIGLLVGASEPELPYGSE